MSSGVAASDPNFDAEDDSVRTVVDRDRIKSLSEVSVSGRCVEVA